MSHLLTLSSWVAQSCGLEMLLLILLGTTRNGHLGHCWNDSVPWEGGIWLLGMRCSVTHPTELWNTLQMEMRRWLRCLECESLVPQRVMVIWQHRGHCGHYRDIVMPVRGGQSSSCFREPKTCHRCSKDVPQTPREKLPQQFGVMTSSRYKGLVLKSISFQMFTVSDGAAVCTSTHQWNEILFIWFNN